MGAAKQKSVARNKELERQKKKLEKMGEVSAKFTVDVFHKEPKLEYDEKTLKHVPTGKTFMGVQLGPCKGGIFGKDTEPSAQIQMKVHDMKAAEFFEAFLGHEVEVTFKIAK